MILWTILTFMACSASVMLAIPLIRRYEANGARHEAGIAVYQDQLAEIERDRASGEIGGDQADAARLEIQRRLLAALKAPASSPTFLTRGWRTAAIIAVTGFVALGSAQLYGLFGSPDALAVSAAASAAVVPMAPANAAGNVDDMIGRLAARLEKEPGDAEGWRMLGWSYFNTQRYDEAAAAYARAVALAPGDLSFASSHAEAMVQAAGGIVTPGAKAEFEDVLAREPKEERSRFYLALATEQAGKSKEALGQWLSLLADAPPEAGWLGDVRSHIADLGTKSGRDVSAALASAAVPDPDAATRGGQQEMIAGMVERLAQRLEAAPHDADGWKRLIRSRAVLHETELASEALRKALAEFAGDPAASLDLANLARELGVTAGN